ncbi:hypothetical protein OPQ81_005316 [Rhizoctonia solani]|nr:hypothetical protein OPQ81_005316 [Rhizoctonia solani]
MILDGSENGDSKITQTIRSESTEADPQTPPPYTPSPRFTNSGDQKPLPTPPHSPPESSTSDYEPRLPQGLPPPCNHLIQRRSNDSIKGTWHVDPAMSIPDALLASFEDFNGIWNEADQKAQKERKKLEKKGKGRAENRPLSPNAIRPNLMLSSSNGSIDAKVHVIPSDGQPRTGLIIAESRNGSIVLDIKTYTPHPLRIYAISENGSVHVRVPDAFEGAVILTSKYGSTKISDPIKSRMTTFSGVSDTTRAFIGDWQGAGFGATTSSSSTNPNDDPPLPTTLSDPFLSWSGPSIHIASRNGSVHLSYYEEVGGDERGIGLSSAFKEFMSGLFRAGGRIQEKGGCAGPSGTGGSFPWGNGPPWGDAKYPWGNVAPWVHPGITPVNPPGPFGRGSGPFAHGSPFGRGFRSHIRGGFGGYSSGCSRRNGSEEHTPHDGEKQIRDEDGVERDPYGFPKDKKGPPMA